MLLIEAEMQSATSCWCHAAVWVSSEESRPTVMSECAVHARYQDVTSSFTLDLLVASEVGALSHSRTLPVFCGRRCRLERLLSMRCEKKSACTRDPRTRRNNHEPSTAITLTRDLTSRKLYQTAVNFHSSVKSLFITKVLVSSSLDALKINSIFCRFCRRIGKL